MKLFLSSYHLGNHPKKLVGLLSSNKKVAIIANSRDFLEDTARKESVQQEIKDLIELDLIPEELDLRDYFGKKNDLSKKLVNFGLVWVIGGNTFILRRAMDQSGFDELIKEKNKDSDFVYAGYSAGICVLSPTLHGLEIVDDPNIAPARYKSKIIWDGLNIVNFSIAPHYKSDHPESFKVDETVIYFIKNKMPFKTLHDGEVIIINH